MMLAERADERAAEQRRLDAAERVEGEMQKPAQEIGRDPAERRGRQRHGEEPDTTGVDESPQAKRREQTEQRDGCVFEQPHAATRRRCVAIDRTACHQRTPLYGSAWPAKCRRTIA